MTTPATTTRLGPYELLREVGYGGMGSVYLGRRLGLGGFHKWVAIKTIHPHLAKEAGFVTMFLDEARTAASMQHPNVTTVFDVGEADGTYFLAMEYLHGEHLGVFQDTGAIDPHLAAHTIARAAEGLHHAHEITDERGVPRGLVHRDVSPHNIFLTYDGHVKVTDFGIARAEGRLAKTTETGRIKGKCAYMAPEQVQAQPLDRRADLFALGVVLWELTTGERLYVAPTDAQVLLAILREDPREPSWLVPDYPPALEAIVMKCLAREPDDRYASCAELARALDAFVATASRPVGASELAALMHERFESLRRDKDRLLRGASTPGVANALAETVATDAPAPASTPAITVDASPRPAPSEPSGPMALPTKRARGVLFAGLGVLGIVGVVLGVSLGGPERATVRVQSEPSGGRVTLDGAPIPGVTPLVIEDVEQGRHRLEVELEGFVPHDVTIDVDREAVELRYPMRSADASARDETARVDGADEAPQGTVVATPIAAAATPVAPTPTPSNDVDEPSVTTTSEMRSTPRPSTPRRSERARATTSAEPTPSAGRATLSLLTEPWATVRIGGRDYGRTPLFARDVPAGRLQIELRARGEGDVVTRTVDAAVGQAVSLRVTLPD